MGKNWSFDFTEESLQGNKGRVHKRHSDPYKRTDPKREKKPDFSAARKLKRNENEE